MLEFIETLAIAITTAVAVAVLVLPTLLLCWLLFDDDAEEEGDVDARD